jgi:hypothetical protein
MCDRALPRREKQSRILAIHRGSVVPDPEVVVHREANRSKVAYREGFDGAMKLDRALREETPRIGLWLDTSDHRPDDTVDEIVERGLSDGQIE